MYLASNYHETKVVEALASIKTVDLNLRNSRGATALIIGIFKRCGQLY